MKFPTQIILIAVLFTSYSCNKSLDNAGIALPSSLDEISDIITIADCTSPMGDYLTEVRSMGDGSCLFIQKSNTSNHPFIAKIKDDGLGYVLSEHDNIIDTLSRENVEMIRGHEIHKMSINPKFFFDEISLDQATSKLDQQYYHAKDGLGQPVKISYTRKDQKITKIELINPRDARQTIEIIYNSWIATKYGDLAKNVDIVQAQKDTFNFNFKSLKIYDKSGNKTNFN